MHIAPKTTHAVKHATSSVRTQLKPSSTMRSTIWSRGRISSPPTSQRDSRYARHTTGRTSTTYDTRRMTWRHVTQVSSAQLSSEQHRVASCCVASQPDTITCYAYFCVQGTDAEVCVPIVMQSCMYAHGPFCKGAAMMYTTTQLTVI